MNPQLEQRLRLYSGLVIAIYLVMHLLNAALGIISLDNMDTLGALLFGFWSNPFLLVILYGAFLIHIVLGLLALFRYRTWRMPLWNLMQTALGLAMPWLLIGHVVGTRGFDLLLDLELNYSQVVTALWSSTSGIVKQYALVAISWLHLCLGIHFWLRHKYWYSRWVLLLYPLSLIIPLLASLGFARAGIETLNLQPEVTARIMAAINAVEPAARGELFLLGDRILQIFIGLLILVVVLRTLRNFRFRRRGDFRVTHTTTEKVLQGHKGQTVLEVLRSAGVQHASICGGRGRCTTCRVRVKDDAVSGLSEPSELEAAALQRVGAGPNIRLACQIRPVRDITITPMLRANISATDAYVPTSVIGQEQQVVCMFADMRGSTSLGEQKMPYDVVFILNHFVFQLSEALRATNGHYANFTGDGIMGLYGLNSDIETACLDALRGAAEIQQRIDKLNSWLADELSQPLRCGVGIHYGVSIVGTMGPPDAPITSAIGDNINISARLEALTKQYATKLVASEGVLRLSGVNYSHLPKHTVQVRGRGETVTFFVIDEPELLLKSKPESRKKEAALGAAHAT